MKKAQIEEIPYDLTAAGHFCRGVALLNGMNVEPLPEKLVYCALEFRNAIERLLFEYIALFSGFDVSKKTEKKYAAKHLVTDIYKVEPEFHKKVEFVNLIFRAIRSPFRMVGPDLERLKRLYGELNDFLHSQKRPEDTCQNREWWGRLKDLLGDAHDLLKTYLSNPIGSVRFNDDGRKTYLEWKEGRISEDQAIDMLRRDFGSAAP